ncbi:response regulator [Winogradskyella ursingii]|uniref:response regulator n=1 Tax=Winogradskyella ursingii TaxID=2686079 RepID=UPI0015C97A94|nr:response regulator [Winogradskyella ursingii]
MNKNILLVDDDEDDRMFFHQAIEEIDSNIHFESRSNGLTALEYLESCSSLPDALFLDINMPILDGFSCLKRLRSNVIFDAIPVIMFSTSYSPETALKLKEAGADFYIKKPNSFIELKILLKKALGLLQHQNLTSKNNNYFLITNE